LDEEIEEEEEVDRAVEELVAKVIFDSVERSVGVDLEKSSMRRSLILGSDLYGVRLVDNCSKDPSEKSLSSRLRLRLKCGFKENMLG